MVLGGCGGAGSAIGAALVWMAHCLGADLDTPRWYCVRQLLVLWGWGGWGG